MTASRETEQPAIAIVGVGALFPRSATAELFWRHILEGRDLITEIPPGHWLIDDYYDPDPASPGKTYSKRGGFLEPVRFDPVDHGIPPANLSATDTAQLLSLVVAKRLLADSGLNHLSKDARERVSVILGVASATELVNTMSGSLQRPIWVKALREQGLPEEDVQKICDRMAANYVAWTESTFPGLLGNVVAGRIANRFDFGGTNCVVDAACAGSLAAVHMAMGELAAGTTDLVITGGVDALNDIFMYMCFSKTPAMSPSGDCRPFAADADGTLLGEGIGLFALRRLEDAERDGNPIYAVIRGIGSSSDGKAKSIYAPRPEGQARALRRAYAAAGYGPETVELLEAHGTGTVAGDAAEFEGLRTVFGGAARADAQWCALGSVKSQIGHTKAAAGSASLFKAVMALHHKVLPPTIKVKAANPQMKLEQSPFYLNTAARPWIRGRTHPRRAGISSFGFGGSNFHVTVEEYDGPGQRPARARTVSHELLLFSGHDLAGVLAEAKRVATDAGLETAFAAAAQDSQRKFDSKAACRLAIVAGNAAELRDKVGAAAANSKAAGVFVGTGPVAAGKIAFVFPAQGSQTLGMGAELLTALDAARLVWDEVVDIDGADGVEIARTVFPPPALTPEEKQRQQTKLVQTEWAQPAIGATSRVYLTLAAAAGLKPDMVCGHSFGELTALHAAGAMDAATFHRLARQRGLRMAEAARSSPGAMLAIKGPAGTLDAAVAEAGPAVIVANRNSPGQVVLAGPVAAIDAAAALLRDKGLTVTRLQVSTAFHSPIVAGATAPFHEDLNAAAIAAPRLPVYGTATAAPYPSNVDAVRDVLARQIAQPVRFADQIAAMYRDGARLFVEVGPGRVLTDLIGQCLGGEPHLAVALGANPREAWKSLLTGLAQLAAAGVPLNLNILWDGYNVQRPEAERFSAATVGIDGANYGKAYPPKGGAAVLPRPNPAPATPATITPSSPAVAAMPPSPTPTADAGPILDAIRDIQRHTAEAHQAAQKAMADAHIAYLQSSQAMIGQLYAALQGGAMPPLVQPVMPVPVVSAPQLSPVAPPPVVSTAAPAPEPVPAVTPAPKPAAAPGVDRRAALLAVIADKTGYPADILRPEMELEADLGIDSIKRVEILAAFRERVPGLPDAALDELGARRTIGDILAALEDSSTPAAAETTAAAPVRHEAPATSAPSADVSGVLFAVVAEKTGYPADILQPEMELEADLGIDSIKRVEILAALRERLPGLPEDRLETVGGLRTLGEIVTALRETTSPAVERPAAPTSPRPASPADTALVRVGLRLRTTDRPASRSAFANNRIAVLDGGSGFGPAVQAALAKHGVQAMAGVTPECDGVIYLGGLTADTSADTAQRVHQEALMAARAFAPRAARPNALFVTVQSTGGDFGLSGQIGERAWLGGLGGLIKTAKLEWPNAAVKAIDIDPQGLSLDAVAGRLMPELLAGGDDVQVGLRADGTRIVLEDDIRPLTSPVSTKLWRDAGSVLVVSGGARGVTAVTLEKLAQAYKPRLLILGRTPLVPEASETAGAGSEAELNRAVVALAEAQGTRLTPREMSARVRRILAQREVAATLKRLEAAGAEVMYRAVDIRDDAAVAAVLGEVRSAWGAIEGLVHGAGVIADKLIADKTEAQFDEVFSTKVTGLRALLAATASDPLRAIVLFSSVAARYGNAGQSDYAMANEVLNKVALAEAARRPNCLVRALNWGPWDSGMVTPALRQRFEAAGVGLIASSAGAAAFVAEIESGLAALEQTDVVLAARPAEQPSERQARSADSGASD